MTKQELITPAQAGEYSLLSRPERTTWIKKYCQAHNVSPRRVHAMLRRAGFDAQEAKHVREYRKYTPEQVAFYRSKLIELHHVGSRNWQKDFLASHGFRCLSHILKAIKVGSIWELICGSKEAASEIAYLKIGIKGVTLYRIGSNRLRVDVGLKLAGEFKSSPMAFIAAHPEIADQLKPVKERVKVKR